MNQEKFIEFTIRPTEKKNCWDVLELELSQDLLEGTGFEGKFPNWKGQVKVYHNVYRSGLFSIKMKKSDFDKIDWEEFNNKIDTIEWGYINCPFGTEWEFTGQEFHDGGYGDWVGWTNLKEEEDNEIMDQQFEEVFGEIEGTFPDEVIVKLETTEVVIMGPFIVEDIEEI